MKWEELKQHFANLMNREPQRATLGTRAMQQVEEGLRHLLSVGHGFEIVPSGTLATLTAPSVAPRSLSIADGLQQTKADPAQAAPEPKFEAKPHDATAIQAAVAGN